MCNYFVTRFPLPPPCSCKALRAFEDRRLKITFFLQSTDLLGNGSKNNNNNTTRCSFLTLSASVLLVYKASIFREVREFHFQLLSHSTSFLTATLFVSLLCHCQLLRQRILPKHRPRSGLILVFLLSFSSFPRFPSGSKK